MHRSNNFDLMRLLFALVVVFVHCCDLSLEPSLAFIPHWINSQIAVEGFFTMSGFLILGSYDRSPSLQVYLEKRARRILPAYWAALVLVLLIGMTLTTFPVGLFWQTKGTWEFVLANLSFMNFLHPSLPGLFLMNPLETSVNGSLWTIKLEIMFYLLVPFIVKGCRRFGAWQVLSVIFFASTIFRVVSEHLGHPSLAKQLPGQLCFFSVGSLAYYYIDWMRDHRKLLWAAGIILSGASVVTGNFVLHAIGVSTLIMCFAFFFPHLQGPTRFGDFSYGMYVYHYPIVQSFIVLGVFAFHPLLSVFYVTTIAAMLAIVSWKCIEKPSLGISRKLPKESNARQKLD